MGSAAVRAGRWPASLARIRVRVYPWGNEDEFEYDGDRVEHVLFEFVVGALQPGISL
jgi:hypothetical protein